MSTLQGDNPCADCGITQNIIWFTEDVLWNEVMRPPGYKIDLILCIRCFVFRVEASGLRPRAWRVLPEWMWERSK